MWSLVAIIIIAVFFYVLAQKNVRSKLKNNAEHSRQDALEVGWVNAEDVDRELSDHGDEHEIRIIIYDALNRSSMSGQIYLTKPPRTILEIPDYTQRIDRYEELHHLPERAKVSLNDQGLWLSADDLEAWEHHLIWVTSDGYEPLLTVLPQDRPTQGGARLVLPLWPAREALGRMWVELLKGLKIKASYGRGDHIDLMNELRRRGGDKLVEYGEEIDASLYAKGHLSTEHLLMWSVRMAQVAKRECPTWSPYQLTPPSDFDRAKVYTEETSKSPGKRG
jgi:hypothetical protein